MIFEKLKKSILSQKFFRVTQVCMACPECQDRLEEMDILVKRVIVVMLDHRYAKIRII